jgi:mRNA interferase YafQ
MKKYAIVATKRYRKDFKRLAKSGLDLRKLENVIDQLASGHALPDRYRDHPLKGMLHGARECHIAPDWLLLYMKDENKLILLLVSTGDHRHMLNME